MPRRPRFSWSWLPSLALGLALVGGPAGCATSKSTSPQVRLQQGRSARALDDITVAQHAAAAVAVVSTDIGRGLAFVVDPRGYLLTNRHVVEDADYIDGIVFPALQPARKFSSVRIVYIDPVRDLALLKVEVDTPLTALPLAATKSGPVAGYLQLDDPILLLTRVSETGTGNKDDHTQPGYIARTGKVRELEVFNPGVGPGAFFGLTQNVQRGMSGGPVLDRYGRAVGVVSWTWKHRVGGYAIPIAEVAEMLAERPAMDTPSQQSTRAEHRAKGFVQAIDTGELELARRMLSPTYARKVRSYTMRTIAEQITGEGRKPVQHFIAALEDLVTSQAATSETLPLAAVQDIVIRTGSDAFMTALGVDGMLSKQQVLSFFFEFSQAYVSARFFAELDPDAAMDLALARLQTIDAARTFAFAEVAQRLSTGDDIQIQQIKVIPGAYAPQAVVHLQVTGKSTARGQPSAPVQLILQLRLEWGDWYVAEVQTTGITG